MVGQVGCDGGSLVRGEGEDVAEAAARVDYCFTGLFRGGDGGSGDDLGCTHGGYVRTSSREGGVEGPAAAVVEGSASACLAGAALG